MSVSCTSFKFETIGFIQSCFTQKFTIPRQPGLVKRAKATLELLPEYSHPDIIRGLEQFSHIWVIFVFHECIGAKKKNTVRPPRLGGNEKMGVFATRSNFRPNPIGQSVVKLEKIDTGDGKIVLHLSGIDILDATPVLDIKPYIPYSDALVTAEGGLASQSPKKAFSVEFSELAESQLASVDEVHKGEFRELIIETLSYDVRPAYYAEGQQKSDFCSQLYEYELKWIIENNKVLVTDVYRNI